MNGYAGGKREVSGCYCYIFSYFILSVELSKFHWYRLPCSDGGAFAPTLIITSNKINNNDSYVNHDKTSAFSNVCWSFSFELIFLSLQHKKVSIFFVYTKTKHKKLNTYISNLVHFRKLSTEFPQINAKLQCPISYSVEKKTTKRKPKNMSS